MTLKTQPFAENKKLARMMGALPFDPQPQGDATGEQGQPAGELAPEAIEKIRRNAQMMDELIGIYRAAGKLEEAAGLEQQYFNQVLTIAQLNTKMAENIWNHSFLSDKYGSLTLKPQRKLKTTLHEGRIVTVDEQTGKVVEVTDLGRHQQVGDSLYFVKDGVPNQIVMGEPKAPTTREVKRNGRIDAEEWRGGQWHVVGSSPQWKNDGEASTGTGKSHKSAQKGLEDYFIQNYGGLLGDSTSGEGKAPDFNTLMASIGKREILDRRGPRSGKPMTVQGLYGAAATYLEDQIAKGTPERKALQDTIKYMNKFGMTTHAEAGLSPEEEEAIKSGKARLLRDAKTGRLTVEPVEQAEPRPAREKKPEALPEQETPPVSLREDAKQRIRSLPGAVDMEEADTGKVEKQILEKRIRDADPEREKAEIERLASYYRRQGAPPAYARKRAEEQVKPKYEELRRIIAEYLGEGEQ